MAFAPVFARPFSPMFDRHAAAGAAAAGWWEVAGKTCVAAYQPKSAASLVASYINKANPGTYDADVASGRAAPVFDTSYGWSFDGISQGLTTNINPNAQAWTYLIRFSDAEISSDFLYIFGRIGTGCTIAFGVAEGAGNLSYYNGGGLAVATRIASGVLAIAGTTAYRNGVAEAGTIGAYGGTSSNVLYVGWVSGLTGGNIAASKIQAVAIYSDTLTAPQVAAVSAAMAAL